jgi:hypothetical protein
MGDGVDLGEAKLMNVLGKERHRLDEKHRLAVMHGFQTAISTRSGSTNSHLAPPCVSIAGNKLVRKSFEN